VEVQAIGDRLTLLVNGVQVASRVDGSLRMGGVGVFTGGDFNQVALERFVVRLPSGSTPIASGAEAAAQATPAPAPTDPAPTQAPQPPQPISRVVIPRLSLDAAAVPAKLVEWHGGQTWQVPAFKIGHAEDTAGAGGPGNAVLVGHVTSQNVGNVFHDLHLVHPGDIVQVFSGEREFEYHVVDVRTVDRKDVSIVRRTDVPSLTLLTCTGAWLPVVADYAQRLVVRAELESPAT
jgi:LPXTG-site transpeptidase (sortase) family protein